MGLLLFKKVEIRTQNMLSFLFSFFLSGFDCFFFTVERVAESEGGVKMGISLESLHSHKQTTTFLEFH